MLKHANISRTSKAQQTLQLQRQWQRQQQHSPTTNHQSDCNNNYNNNINDATLEQTLHASIETANISLESALLSTDNSSTPPTHPPPTISTCDATSFLRSLSSPTRTSPQTTTGGPKLQGKNDSEHSWNSLERPAKMLQALNGNTKNKNSIESIVKVFAQSLSQEVEYVSLKVSPQTKSQQIIKTLLKKFRLRHRDPNLFYLTLERWIRKDGLKYKSVMLLGDETCPLQLQQCCSNPPHDDIKFTLQMRSGALIKIFCFDIAPEARYKCLSLSTQTTVDETIELLLHCLNLFNTSECSLSLPLSTTNLHHQRLTCSPGSIGSSSSASSTSSSSGMESDFPPSSSMEERTNHNLVNDSRASSVTSISSTSNISTISSSIIEQYCLVVECRNATHCRTLNSDEYLVEVYQNLVAEAKLAPKDSSSISSDGFNSTSDSAATDDQWFSIKLKKRDVTESIVDVKPSVMKLRISRQNLPLPPIPTLPNTLVNRNLHFNSSSLMTKPQASSNNRMCIATMSKEFHSFEVEKQSQELGSRMPPPPQFIFLPPIQPRRRRNLSNVSSTFGRPLQNTNRRRYDPAQLAEDLIKLEVAKNSESEFGEIPHPPPPPPPPPPPSTSSMTDKMLRNQLVSSFESAQPNVHAVKLETAAITN